MDLVLVEESYVHTMSHLMVMETANHGQIKIVMLSHKMKAAKTCSLTRRMETLQLPSLKFGE